MADKLTIKVIADYSPFNGEPKAREKYLAMRLQEDIQRAARGRDPQVLWNDHNLWDALELIAKTVREMKRATEEKHHGPIPPAAQ